MRLSVFFLPTLKETPAEAQIVSHRLMLRAGMVRQSSAGIYSWLPFGYKVLMNIQRIVEEEQDAIGCQQMLMPTIQPADLWRKSGRYDAYGPEMLRGAAPFHKEGRAPSFPFSAHLLHRITGGVALCGNFLSFLFRNLTGSLLLRDLFGPLCFFVRG